MSSNLAAPTRLKIPLPALLLAALALAGCGGVDASGAPDRPFDFPEGDFQVTTLGIEDRCLDGGLHPLFMPQGTGTPWDWTYPIRLHPPEALPQTYPIRLRDPFGEMTVRAERVGDTEERVRGLQNTGVVLNEDLYGDCVADLDADVAITLYAQDRAAGRGALLMSNPRGAEGRCPDSDRLEAGCQVLLELSIRRTVSGG